MGAIIGFVIGYVIGTRGGEEGFAEFKQSWDVISQSEEVRDMIEGAVSVGRDLFGRGRSVLAERLEPRLSQAA